MNSRESPTVHRAPPTAPACAMATTAASRHHAVTSPIAAQAMAVAPVRTFARQTGPALSPFNAWLLSKSLETLGAFSNLDAAPMYVLRRFDVTRHRGTAIRISFTGVQSQGPPTWFLLDDAELNIWQ